jgi:beta-glucosidase
VAALQAGALCVMASFSSWQGLKMHAHRYLLTDVLKDELGFRGFVVSDWMAVDQIDPDFSVAVTRAINAGLDMVMVPYDYPRFMATLTAAVERGDVPASRIDDAVARILRVKFALGLFERPHTDPGLLARVGCPDHRALAREAVRRSVVLLRNEGEALPRRAPGLILVAGEAGDDLGPQCGGWTIKWQGVSGRNATEGTTILEGLQQTAPLGTRLEFNRFGRFDHVTDAAGAPLTADLGVVVLHEAPYAEGLGDRADLCLSAGDLALIQRVRARSRQVAVLLVTGRPLIITEALPLADAWLAVWWPGSEGAGVGDVVFGHHPFTGRLPYHWPRTMGQLPLDALLADPAGPLFPHGFGLTE